MIERTQDQARVQKFRDTSGDPIEDSYYLLEVVDGEDLGVWYFHPCEDGMMIHVGMSEKCRGSKAADSGRRAMKWIHGEMGAKTIYVGVNPRRHDIRSLVCSVGFEFLTCYGGDRIYRKEL